jgi:hypothetical protein
MEIERTRVPTPIRWEVVRLRLSEETFRGIEEETNISKSEAQRIWAKYNSDCHVKDRPKSGRPPLLNARGERVLVRSLLSEPTVSLREKEKSERVSRRTMSRILRANGVLSYRLVLKMEISPKNMKKRVDWCKKYKSWTTKDWEQVIFSDESAISKILGRKFYRRRFSDPPTYGSVKKQGSFPIKVMFWGSISSIRVGRLILMDETLTAEFYIKLLQNNLTQSFRGLATGSLYYQQDNAPIHTAKRKRIILKHLCLESWNGPLRALI